MSQVLARFYLTEVTRTQYYSGGETKEATSIKLAPVKGEPFGPATPNGSIQMLIVNSDAAKTFLDAPVGQEFSILFTPTG